MYRKAMVTLDGSDLAECALPHAQAIAAGCGVPEVVLARVAEDINIPMSDNISEIIADSEGVKKIIENHRRAARDYLDDVKNRFPFPGSDVVTMVLEGPPAEALLSYAETHEVGLIIVSTHGHSGISRWVRGHVADKILHSAAVPVLLVKAPGAVKG